jgi:acetyl-CoA synthetase
MNQKLARTSGAISSGSGVRGQPYPERYAESMQDPEAFWGRIGKRLSWSQPYSKVKDVSFQEQDFRIR